MTNKEKLLYILDCISNDAGRMEESLLEILSEDGLSEEFDYGYETLQELMKSVKEDLKENDQDTTNIIDAESPIYKEIFRK